MLSRALESSGVWMGPFKDDNAESRLFAWELTLYLASIGVTWEYPYGAPQSLLSENYAQDRKLFLENIELKLRFMRKISFNKLVGFKHPLASLVLEDLTMLNDVKLIGILRSHREIALSLSKRKVVGKSRFIPRNYPYGIRCHDLSYGERLSLFYTDKITKFSIANRDKIFLIDYNTLVDHRYADMILRDLSAFIGKSVSLNDLNLDRNVECDRPAILQSEILEKYI